MNNAYEIPNLRFSGVAGALVRRHRFVMVDALGFTVESLAEQRAVGVSRNEAAVGEPVECADGIVIVEAAGPILPGVPVQSGINGRAVPLAAGVELGICMTLVANAGELCCVKVK